MAAHFKELRDHARRGGDQGPGDDDDDDDDDVAGDPLETPFPNLRRASLAQTSSVP